ncbi:MAG: mannose-1-phosphate guanylyltransferase/mannose-6-phosphate isomerase [Hyphomicrobiaceae bacterium]
MGRKRAPSGSRQRSVGASPTTGASTRRRSCTSLPPTVVPIILSGGSGKRLWPLSRQDHPKQFQSILARTSPFQETCLRLADGIFASPVVIAHEDHRFLIAEQMRSLGLTAEAIVLEPGARNTAMATLVGAVLAAEDEPDRLLLVTPSDHRILDPHTYRQAIATGIPAAHHGAIVLFGVVPDRPETGYGYIEVSPGTDAIRSVMRFVEKPERRVAEDFVDGGRHLWNSGIFLMSARTIIEAAERHCPEILAAARSAHAGAQRDLDFTRLAAPAYRALPSLSLDHAIIEKAAELRCVPLEVGWTDIGSWPEVWRSADKDPDGNVTHGDVHCTSSRNCLAYADQGTVSVVGLEDTIVVATGDAVLVTSMSEAQSVKDIVARLEDNRRDEAVRHRRVLRPWGWYERLAAGSGYQVKWLMIAPGASLSLQYHRHRAEHWVVVSGSVEVTIEGAVSRLHENQSIDVPVYMPHRLANPGEEPAFLIEVQSGVYLGEDDIVRIKDVYGRAE